MYDLSTLAKYPFFSESKSYVQKEAPTMTELLDDTLYERVRMIAVDRLDAAINKKEVAAHNLSTESDYLMELLSYPLARMITVCIGDPFFTKRYAHSEAVRMYKNLIKEHISFILNVAREFDIDFSYDANSETLSVYFVHYLRFAPTRYKTWKMINREMANGYIKISEKDFSRLLQEALRSRINNELGGKNCNPYVQDVFSEEILRIRNEVMMLHKKIETEPIGKLDVIKLPPCLKDILAAIQSGENVAHMGRFALVAFLNSLKMTQKDILQVFSTAPDFEEEKTRYQIDHITGLTGATSYSAPGCDKLKTYGFCPSEKIDNVCRQVNHPMKYYRRK